MFIPIGGIFVFGNGATRSGAITNIVIGIINLIMSAVVIAIGLGTGFTALVVLRELFFWKKSLLQLNRRFKQWNSALVWFIRNSC